MEATEVTVPARAAVEQLIACGVTHVVWLPDSESGFMYEALTQAEADGRLRLVPICREGEAVPLAFGIQIGGKKPAILIQNTGFYEAGDSLRGQAIDLGLPLVLLIGYRGWRANRAEMVDSAGVYLEPILRAWGVPYYLVEQPEALPRIREAFDEAERRSGPVAVLIAGEWE